MVGSRGFEFDLNLISRTVSWSHYRGGVSWVDTRAKTGETLLYHRPRQTVYYELPLVEDPEMGDLIKG